MRVNRQELAAEIVQLIKIHQETRNKVHYQQLSSSQMAFVINAPTEKASNQINLKILPFRVD